MSESIKESRQVALISESELWEFLIEKNLESDFKQWVINYRESLNQN